MTDRSAGDPAELIALSRGRLRRLRTGRRPSVAKGSPAVLDVEVHVVLVQEHRVVGRATGRVVVPPALE